MSEALVPPELVENLFPVSLPASGVCWMPGIPWLVEVSSRSLLSCSHGLLLACKSVSKFPLFRRTPVIGSRALTHDFILLGSSVKTLFPNKSHSQVLRVKISTSFQGLQLSP